MGDAADMVLEAAEAESWALQDELAYMLEKSDDELRKATARSRTPKIVSIRKWPGKLSDKQRYCLARWSVENDCRGMMEEKALDKQVAGNHYKQMKIQPVEFIHANNISYLEGNVIKYICRHRNKNGVDDLLKAKHYIELLIELEYQGEEK